MGSSKRVRALIFDFDGLIVDSETPGYQAWSELYRLRGYSLPFEKYSACIGTLDGFDPLTYLEELADRPLDRAATEAECHRRYMRLMIDRPVLPGVVECVAAAKRQGMKLAVASSSTRKWVAGHLTRLDLIDKFDAVCCRDDVRTVKPDPALYLLALEKLGVDAAEAVALEDSPNGILAAKRAGIFCIAIPNTLTVRLSLDLADRRLSSLSELSLEDSDEDVVST